MKSLAIAFALLQLIGLTGCISIKPALDPYKSYEDSGTVIHKIGDSRCQVTVKTDRRGIFQSDVLTLDECDKLKIDTPVKVQIYSKVFIKILP